MLRPALLTALAFTLVACSPSDTTLAPDPVPPAPADGSAAAAAPTPSRDTFHTWGVHRATPVGGPVTLLGHTPLVEGEAVTTGVALERPSPVAQVHVDEGITTVRNTSAHDVGPLWVVTVANRERHYHYVERLESGAEATFEAEHADIHGNRAGIYCGLDAELDDLRSEHDVLIRAIRGGARRLGLSDEEARAFVDALSDDLLAPPTEVGAIAPPEQDLALPWTVFGFYGEQASAAAATWTAPAAARPLTVVAFALSR